MGTEENNTANTDNNHTTAKPDKIIQDLQEERSAAELCVQSST